MNADTKQQSKSTAKTVGIATIGAAIVAAVTMLVLPTAPPKNPRSFKAQTDGTSNWDIVYTWCYKDDIKGTNWTFHSYTTNTTLLTVDATNEKRFYTITEYFLTGFPAWMTNNQQYRWYRTNL